MQSGHLPCTGEWLLAEPDTVSAYRQQVGVKINRILLIATKSHLWQCRFNCGSISYRCEKARQESCNARVQNTMTRLARVEIAVILRGVLARHSRRACLFMIEDVLKEVLAILCHRICER
jgi:hypothetical protein